MTTLTFNIENIETGISGIDYNTLTTWAHAVDQSVSTLNSIHGLAGTFSLIEQTTYDTEKGALTCRFEHVPSEKQYSIVVDVDKDQDEPEDRVFRATVLNDLGEEKYGIEIVPDSAYVIEDIHDDLIDVLRELFL